VRTRLCRIFRLRSAIEPRLRERFAVVGDNRLSARSGASAGLVLVAGTVMRSDFATGEFRDGTRLLLSTHNIGEDMKPTRIFLVRLFLLLSTIVCSFPALAASYTFISIDYPGAAQTDAYGISNSGQVVGNFYDAAFNALGSYSYNGSFKLIPPPSGSLATSLSGVNVSGVMDGAATFDGVTGVGFIRSSKRNYTTFAHPGSSDTEGRAINDNGLITGFYLDPTESFNIGFIYYSSSNTFQDIGPGPVVNPSAGTIAQGVSNNGQVVGSSVLVAAAACPTCAQKRYGWLRSASGATMVFDVNGVNTAARGITDSGLITGFINGNQGFVTTLGGSSSYQSIPLSAVQLVTFPGAAATLPEAITNGGVIAGIWNDAEGNSHGFVAIPSTVATSKDQCKGSGWQSLTRIDGTTFKNQGDCVSYTNNGD
jgi:hypothetical protein